jgi:hypothetical protein
MPLLSRVPNHSNRHTLVAIQHLCIKASKATKALSQGQVTRYKHVKGLDLPYVVQVAQPRLTKRVTSFLLASGPTWRSPPPMESRLPHSHLYPSPRRFPVESHLLLGCSHKIPNGTSSAFDLSRCNTAASNTILGLCSQGLSRHVLPHAAPGFFAGRGHKGWWSSPNFASILLAPRDDILALCSGGRTRSQGTTILSSGVAMVFSLGLASHGSRPLIYSSGAPHQISFILPDSTTTLSGYCLHVEHDVFCLLSEALTRLQQA